MPSERAVIHRVLLLVVQQIRHDFNEADGTAETHEIKMIYTKIKRIVRSKLRVWHTITRYVTRKNDMKVREGLGGFILL